MPIQTAIDSISNSQGSPFGFKNRIINGAMVIDQRQAGAVHTPTSSLYCVDRWHVAMSQNSKFTAQQNAGAVTPPPGFVNYQGITSSSAYAVGASDYFVLRQAIEGNNVSDLDFGTANAKTITVSFWVRSSLTGTFGGSLYNSNGSRSYPFSYTINSANTWEYKTITIPGDTTGTWAATTGAGLYVSFSFGAGSTYNSPANAWAGGFYTQPSGSTSVVGTNGATFYITGVQLEKGTQATAFDYRDYGNELRMCQRYCFVPTTIPMTGGSSSFIGNLQFPVTMRSAPSLDTTKLGTYKNSSSFGVGPGANEFGIQNFVSGNSVGFSGVTPTSLGQTTQSTQVTYIYQVSGTTPSESTSVMNYVCSFGTGSRLILSAEL